MSKLKEISKSERILDTAEQLFAEHGYDGVTIRQIANGAGVDVALASYHFGKKIDIFKAAFNRRARILSDTRSDMLKLHLEDNEIKKYTLEQIIEAFLQPLKIAQQTGDSGWQHYLALLAYIMTSSVWSKEMLGEIYDKRVNEFIHALKIALPNANETDIHWCYQFVSGSLALTLAQTGRIDRLSKGLCQSTDFDAAYERMIPFIAAGFRQVCDKNDA